MDSNKSKSILIVDNEPEILNLYKEEFELHDYEVNTANNGAQALEILDEFTPDLVLSDINMPVMNGLELVENLKAIGFKAPIVLMTGFPEVTREQAIKCGAIELLFKPFNFKRLLDVCEKLLKEAI